MDPTQSMVNQIAQLASKAPPQVLQQVLQLLGMPESGGMVPPNGPFPGAGGPPDPFALVPGFADGGPPMPVPGGPAPGGPPGMPPMV
jgi:hypothetical protein